MLSYAFKILQEKEYKKIALEKFSNTADLCAEILAKVVSHQLKRGLNKEYVLQKELLCAVRGKIDINESIKRQTMIKGQLVCIYDDFNENSYLNKIIKTTMLVLIRSDIAKERQKALRKILLFFTNIDVIDIHKINWNIRFNRNNQTYKLLINICYLVIKGLIQTEKKGKIKLLDFFDEQRMSMLYERFLLEFYKKELPNNICVSSPQIKWKLDNDNYDSMLPNMKTDMMLSYEDKILIIDAKYYSKATQEQFGSRTIHSNNLYQIFAYVKNKQAEYRDDMHEVAGMLLYAKTDEAIVPNNSYVMMGNRISANNIDLNCDFEEIKKQLITIVNDWIIAK